MMNGWWTAYSYVGVMSDGSEREFVSEDDYREAFEAWDE